MEIPYAVDERPDTGLTNPRLGMWLFLASEAMLFGSLISAYVLLRGGAEFWPHQADYVNRPLALLNTGILLTSSVTIAWARASLRVRNFTSYRVYMALTVLGGTGFLLLKSLEWGEKFAHHLYPATNIFLGIYFALTGLHLAHVLGGVLLNAWLLASGRRVWAQAPARLTGRVEVAALYWHFVDVVWLILFPLLYLL